MRCGYGRTEDSSLILLIILWIGSVAYWGIYGAIGFPAILCTLSAVSSFSRWLADKCPHDTRRYWNGKSRCKPCDEEFARHEEVAAKKDAEQKASDEAKAEEDRHRARHLIRNLDHLSKMDPFDFERLALWIHRVLGWDTQATPRSNDRGIDGILRKGPDRIVVQCKRLSRERRVPGATLRDLLGTVVKEDATGGLLVTTSDLTEEAKSWIADAPRLSYINGERLIRLVDQAVSVCGEVPREFGMIPSESAALETCPRCGALIRIVSGRGGRFLGCSAYPACRWTAGLRSRKRRRTIQRRLP